MPRPSNKLDYEVTAYLDKKTKERVNKIRGNIPISVWLKILIIKELKRK